MRSSRDRFGWLRIPISCLLLFLLHFLALLKASYSQSCDSADMKALLSFSAGLYHGIRGWESNSSVDCCDWPGISCDAAIAGRRVSSLDLSGKDLRGPLNDSLADLDHLTELNLSFNSLQGSPPPKLFRLNRLLRLDLSVNQLSGSLPSELELPSIRFFNISNNLFNGSLPVLSRSANLQFFDVSNNSFSGEIPASICNSSAQIQSLRFSMNSLSGDFPVGLMNCHLLVHLSLNVNEISGVLPDDFFTLLTLKYVNLQQNKLSGPLSQSVGNLSSLVELDLSLNGFFGFIPDVFDGLPKLESFSAHSNRFDGSLPGSFANLRKVRVLNLRNNSLTGEVGLNFAMLPMLNSLDLGSNRFTGLIPQSLSQCSNLTFLNLAKNLLTGEIPSGFRNLDSLYYLSLSNNSLTNISSALQTLQHCTNLTVLVLTMNFYGGETMPVEGIYGFPKVEALVIANCGLLGSIPPWLAKITYLMILDISWNQLGGSIPAWLGNFDSLFYIDLSNNSLNGEIPSSFTRMKRLISVNESKQGPSMQNSPFFVKRNASAKPLQYNTIGSFPPSLILSNNKLVGPILPEFGKLKLLIVLDLHNNSLSGTIPAEFSGMVNLETLDLSYNTLTGNIPASLSTLNFLSKFDVAYNNLEGPIPSGGQFSTFSASDFLGNPGLCGFHSTPCQFNTTSHAVNSKKKSKAVIIGVAIGIGTGTTFLLMIIYLAASRIFSRRQAENAKVVAHTDDSLEAAACRLVLLFHNKDIKEISINDILKSTNNFDQSYIIGCGGFGLVYKATLEDGRKVAIKRLSGDFCQMEREFQAEVEALSWAQHENLVLLQGYCRVGTDRLLIYSYMENGSLDYWLHERTDGSSALSWPKRLKIAQGAARGLAYLHESCRPSILHRDIKSSNILLDEHFEAHLADFGLARLILPCDTHVSTDLVGTLGYIPPEYSQASVATFKGDVYSFGMVLLELLTGRRPVDICKPKGSRELVLWVHEMKKEKREVEVFDPHIYHKELEGQLLWVLEIASCCVIQNPKLRPSTQQLVSWLESIAAE
ncbi:Phytosulfokine receptor 1 [Apostasia shenzhenica]|uniref:non-specific serine/threonine protein kinase n=1 Tax=Apostasia shenzhenica TaxID=1088818 RepID=A0A2I0BBK3_9ASPA|nr:Phytosulfokine receptor 1 [Apostasia shenzhenica]